MAVSSTGKTAINMLESYKETYDEQDSMLDLVSFNEPDGGSLQDAGNFVWKNVEQHRPVISGWDVSNEQQGIIQETYPCVLGTPNNDVIEQRADQMRTDRYWENAAATSAKQQATQLNTDIATAIKNQGSIFYRSNTSSGWDFIGLAQTIMNERQLQNNGRSFILNDRDNYTFSQDLAARQTLQGRPETIWSKGQIAQNVAGFENVMVGSFLPVIVGDADPGASVNAATSFAPSGGTVNATTGVVTNVDYRSATITTDGNTSFVVGDKITFASVNSVGLADKTDTSNLMTFTIIDVDAGGTDITVYPKPIAPASSDTSLTTLEGSYSNISAQIGSSAAITRLNIDTTDPRVNIFFDKKAIEVMGGTIPAQRYAEFAGKKVISTSLKNGLKVYMLYDGDILATTFTFRIFTWYGITVCDPSNCGVAVKY
jgi:hypothetical protein